MFKVIVAIILILLPELIYLRVKTKRKVDLSKMDDKTPIPTFVQNPGTHTFTCNVEDFNKWVDRMSGPKGDPGPVGCPAGKPCP